MKSLKFFRFFFVLNFFWSPLTLSDSFEFNSYNNHGIIGLINTPSARLYNEGTFGVTVYDGTPDQKITITAAPYDWLEASFFYSNIQGKPYPGYEYQDYKDKGFNFKIRIKEEGNLPAIAIGVNDIAGSGFFSSEYLVASYGIENLDFHLGLGWGTLNSSDKSFKNPLNFIHESFSNRPSYIEQEGGQFQLSRYFSGEVSPFYGISYAINENFIFKLEQDTTKTDGIIEYDSPSKRQSLGLEYKINRNFTIGLSRERNNFYSIKFTYQKNANTPSNRYKYESAPENKSLNKYGKLINNLNKNGIGVNKIYETAESIGLELTQFSHPNLDLIEEILYIAKADSGITKDLKKQYMIADLEAYSEIDNEYIKNSKLIYERERQQNFITNTKLNIRPFLAAREGFLKASVLVENNSEYIIKDNFFFASNIKYSIKDNFNDLFLPPIDTFPAQVRSDIKDYLRRLENRFVIGRAQFDYHLSPKKDHHVMLTAGILEEMFNGYGFEYLYFNSKKSYAYGFELFDVKKRDYDLRFGTLDYRTTTGHINFYYRNYNIIPFDAKISYGKYLAGDIGSTFELSRTFWRRQFW